MPKIQSATCNMFMSSIHIDQCLIYLLFLCIYLAREVHAVTVTLQ